jgi:HK97 family phage major capsid protein
MSNEVYDDLARRLHAIGNMLSPPRLGSSRDVSRWSLSRALRAQHAADSGGVRPHGAHQDGAFELEWSAALSRELQRGEGSLMIPPEVMERQLDVRALSTQPGAKGGFLVGATTMSPIDMLRSRSVAIRMGAQELSGLTSNLAMARQTAKPSVTWQGGDGASTTAGDQALGQLSVSPKTVMTVTDVSEQLLRQGSPSAEAFIWRDLTESIAIDGVDLAAINGAGGAQPRGIKNTDGITTGADLATCTLAKLLALVSTVGTANGIGASPGWVGNTAAACLLAGRQRFTSSDSPLWLGSPSDGLLTGYRAMSSEQLSAANIIFGDWSALTICDWGALELQTSRGGTNRFNQAQVGLRAMWMVDVLIRYPSSFIVSTNLS